MKHISVFSVLTALALLASACRPGGVASDDLAVGRVKSAMSYYQAGNAQAFDKQLSPTERRQGFHCPDGGQYGCVQTMYKNFAAEHHTVGQKPVSLTFFLFGKQTTPNVQMVLVEGNWGGSPEVISCQVFFVISSDSGWLIDNFDSPDAMTCQRRSEELMKNLFGPTPAPTLLPTR
jgi:hypothetical protein